MSSSIKTLLPKIVVKESSVDNQSGGGYGFVDIPVAWKVVLIIGCVVFIVYVILLTSMVNISESMFTDKVIYSEDSRDEYTIVSRGKFNRAMVKRGEEFASDNGKLLVVSLVRNCSGSIPCMEKKLKVLGSVFRDVHMVFFENNSTDDTRKQLLEYALGRRGMGSENVRVTVVNPFTMRENEEICTSDSNEFANSVKAGVKGASYGRINRMAYLRNKVLDYVYAHQSEYTTLLMTDMDIIGRIFPTGIKETVGYLRSVKNIGFVTFRGFFPSGGFFDPYSYKGTGLLSQSKLTTLMLCMTSYFLMPSGKGLQPVVSSHSGGIFANLPLPPRLRYSCDHVVTVPFVTDVYLCEHVTLMEKVPNNFVNTNMSFLVKDNV